MANSKVPDLNQMKSPQQQQNNDTSKAHGASDAKASDQQVSPPTRQQDVQGDQHGSDKQHKSGNAQQK